MDSIGLQGTDVDSAYMLNIATCHDCMTPMFDCSQLDLFEQAAGQINWPELKINCNRKVCRVCRAV